MIDKEAANQMINSIWCADGKTWSDRVWTNTSKLQQALNDNIIDCVLTGKKSGYLKQELVKEFDVSFSRADSIVRTELAHIQTEAAKQRYKDSGIKEVEVIADWDERRCPICADLHHTIHPIGGKMPVPAHPRCRCCIVPVVESYENEQLKIDRF
jgi:SPP1 gp7 family putative phage head morphogenesis protein